MKKTYTKKQITEAIAYWEKVLEDMNESATYSQFENVRKFLSEQLGYDCSRMYRQEGFGDIIDDLFSIRAFEHDIVSSEECKECVELTKEYRKASNSDDLSPQLQEYFWHREPAKLWLLGKRSRTSSYVHGFTIGVSSEFDSGDKVYAAFFGSCEEAVPLLVWYASFDSEVRSAGLDTQWFFQFELDGALKLANELNFSHGDTSELRQEQYEQIASALKM